MSTLVLAPFFTDLRTERLMFRDCSPCGTLPPVVTAHLTCCVPALLNHSQVLRLDTLSHPRIFAHAATSVCRSLPFSPYSPVISRSSSRSQLRHLLLLKNWLSQERVLAATGPHAFPIRALMALGVNIYYLFLFPPDSGLHEVKEWGSLAHCCPELLAPHTLPAPCKNQSPDDWINKI